MRLVNGCTRTNDGIHKSGCCSIRDLRIVNFLMSLRFGEETRVASGISSRVFRDVPVEIRSRPAALQHPNIRTVNFLSHSGKALSQPVVIAITSSIRDPGLS